MMKENSLNIFVYYIVLRDNKFMLIVAIVKNNKRQMILL